MTKTTYFTGLGYDDAGAKNNATAQADKFIKDGAGKRKETGRTFVSSSHNGAVYSATLQLNYES